MKRGIFITAMIGVMVVAATSVSASNYHHRRSHVHRHHRPAYPSCRVPPHHGRHGYYPTRSQRHYYHRGYSSYPYSRYGRAYNPHYRSHGHFGVYGRHYSLHFGF